MTAFLEESIQQQVRTLFSALEEPVHIILFTRNDAEQCAYCAETQQLLEEVSALSEKIHFEVLDLDQNQEQALLYKVDSAPEFVLAGWAGNQPVDYGIRYKGIPAGHEFSSLINDLVLISQHKSNLKPETRAFLQSLDQPVHLQVFVTPSCPYCPRAVVLAHQFALESPWIEADMVEATEFPELANRFSVSGVPQTTINAGAGTLVGAAPEERLVEEIRQALGKTISVK